MTGAGEGERMKSEDWRRNFYSLTGGIERTKGRFAEKGEDRQDRRAK